MKVFYINSNEFKSKYDKICLNQYADIDLKTDKRFYEYTIGRFIVKNVAEQVYNISNPEIIKNEKGKPIFRSGELYFNISHSNEYIMACFDDKPCGIDIEYIKQRDLARLSKYYGRKFTELDEFYKFWTLKESEYKLSESYKDRYTVKFKENYYVTITSTEKIKLPVECFNTLDVLNR